MIQLTNERLKKKNKIVKENVKDCFSKALKVKAWLKNKPAYAVAFNQLGFNERCVVFKKPQQVGFTEIIIYNPEYRHLAKDKIKSIEACLSFPGVNYEIKRYSSIYATYDIYQDGELVTIKNIIISGMAAIVFQHETDHLNGKSCSRGKVYTGNID